MESVYQHKKWLDIKEKAGYKSILITSDSPTQSLVCFERNLTTPFGTKKILVAEGTPFFDEKTSLILLKKFKKLANKRYFYGTIAPKVLANHKIFSKAKFKHNKNNTLLIDLTKSEDELWKGLEKKSSRWGVKTALKNNLTFEEIKENEIGTLYNLYKETTQEGHFNAISKDFLINLVKNKEIARIFVVKKDKKIIAGGAILIDPEYTILNLTSANQEGYKLQAMPFLYWELIKFLKSLNKKYFDLGGYDLEAKEDSKMYKVNKFKNRFGGQIVEQPIYSTNWKYPFLRKINNFYKKIKNGI